MKLIKNKDKGQHVTNDSFYCSKCNNNGIIMVKKQDRDIFDEEYDRLDKIGSMAPELIYRKAVEKSQCIEYYYCPYCEEGQKYKNNYDIYRD